MKVLQVYNQYRSSFGGEETVVRRTEALLQRHGHDASLWMRSSRGLDRSLGGRVRAFVSGIYSRSAYREMAARLNDYRPDLVHAHNLYPLLSPSLLVACREAGVPVVMSLHNYFLTCPKVDHLSHGHICERCMGGREYWCLLKNCRENVPESLAYALRSLIARKMRWFHDHITMLITLNGFSRQKLVDAGFDANRILVLPNMVELCDEPSDPAAGQYVAFAGRLQAEKGVDVLLRAAAKIPNVPFRLAGEGPLFDRFCEEAPPHVHMLGRLDGSGMVEFYRKTRLVALPSKWFEMCPLVLGEAMSHGLPAVASRLGGIPELVDDGTTGLLFQSGNAGDLAEKINRLWNDPALCCRMGQAARKKAIAEYGEQRYYERLMDVYHTAIEYRGGCGPQVSPRDHSAAQADSLQLVGETTP